MSCLISQYLWRTTNVICCNTKMTQTYRKSSICIRNSSISLLFSNCLRMSSSIILRSSLRRSRSAVTCLLNTLNCSCTSSATASSPSDDAPPRVNVTSTTKTAKETVAQEPASKPAILSWWWGPKFPHWNGATDTVLFYTLAPRGCACAHPDRCSAHRPP